MANSCDSLVLVVDIDGPAVVAGNFRVEVIKQVLCQECVVVVNKVGGCVCEPCLVGSEFIGPIQSDISVEGGVLA